MFFVKVSGGSLSSRLDAEFYEPSVLKISENLAHSGHGRLQDFVIGFLRDPFCYGFEQVEYKADKTISYVKGEDLQDVVIGDTSSYVDERKLESFRKVSLKNEDLVMSVRGHVGHMAVFNAGSGLPSPNVMAIRLDKGKLLPFYAAVFFNSHVGKALVRRHVSGSVQETISSEEIRAIQCFVPSREAQKYIGDKVRQAEQLRESARLIGRIPAIVEAVLRGKVSEQILIDAHESLQNGCNKRDREILSLLEPSASANGADDSFLELIRKCKWESVDNERELTHINRVSSVDIEDFLTAQTYRPEITRALEVATSGKHEPLQRLCMQPIRQGTTPKFSRHGKNCLKAKQTREVIIDDAGFETVDPSDPDNRSIIRLVDGDIVISRQGAGTVGRASIFLGDSETYITDSLFVVRVDKNKADPGYIAAYLRAHTGKRLIEKGVYGSTGQLNLAGEHVRNIPVMNLDLAAQNYIGDKVRLLNELYKYSKSLVRASKSIVEALIDGRLTEAQLINAQKALDADDNSQDRDILERLTTSGADGDGESLFPDLDRLYDLLAKSQSPDE